MLLLDAACFAVCDLSQPVAAVEEVQVLLRACEALLLAHRGTRCSRGTQQHCDSIQAACGERRRELQGRHSKKAGQQHRSVSRSGTASARGTQQHCGTV
jgi:hypothetical protein